MPLTSATTATPVTVPSAAHTTDTAVQPASRRRPSPLPRRISPAAIDRYRRCPRAVYLQYVVRVPRMERPSPVLMVGNAVHAALERFFGLPVTDRSEEVLHRCLRSVWAEHRRPDTFATIEEERDWGHVALRQLADFYGTFDTTATPLARERWVSLRLQNGVELYGKVDRVDGRAGTPQASDPQRGIGRPGEDVGGSHSRPGRPGTLQVVDYKTGRFQLDPDDLRDEPAVQVYLLAVEERYGREVDQVRMLYLASGEEVRWEPEREDVDQAREQLEAVTWRMFTDQEFEPRPGAQCGRCPFAHACPDAGRVELSDLQVEDSIAF